MDKHDFEQLDPLIDGIAENLDSLISSDVLATVKAKLAEISQILGESYSVTLDINVNVFSSEREKNLPLLQTGLSASGGSDPYQCWGDSSPQRYVANGQLCIVPHDHCPVCWGRWDAKELNPACPECGIEMGERVKLLLDSDTCPNCEKGTVTASEPSCSQCSYAVNPDYVWWG